MGKKMPNFYNKNTNKRNLQTMLLAMFVVGVERHMLIKQGKLTISLFQTQGTISLIRHRYQI